jgi:hypothetical protein
MIGNSGTSRAFTFALLTVGLSTVACGGAIETTSQQTAEIVNGEPSRADFMPSVVALVVNVPRYVSSFCTGTLIAKRYVLTASHCLSGGSVPSHVPIGVYFGANASSPSSGIIVPIKRRIVHPEFTGGTPPGTLAKFNDIAIVELTTDAPVEPALMIRPEQVGPSFRTGGEVLIMGFGLTDPQDPNSSGIKYEGRTELRDVGDAEIYINSQSGSTTCQGDSGGPTFVNVGKDGAVDYRLIGVTSRGGEGCAYGSVQTRLDAYLTWIHQSVRDIPCDSGLASRCDGTDPEPIGPSKKAFGQSCTKSEECQDNVCAIVGGQRRCTKYCDTRTPACPARHDCGAIDDEGIRGVCVPQKPAALGESCEKSSDCASELCAGVSGKNICTDFCQPEIGCDGVMQCVSAGGDKHVCVPGNPSNGGGGGCALAANTTSSGPPLLFTLFAMAFVALRRR